MEWPVEFWGQLLYSTLVMDLQSFSFFEQTLLAMPLSDLLSELSHRRLKPLAQRLYRELDQKGISMRPKLYYSTEWYVRSGSGAIAVPFYLHDSHLMRIEQKMMGVVEGKRLAEKLQILRHEMGHVVDDTLGLRKKKSRQKLFGLSSEKEKTTLASNTGEFVEHLEGWYAQTHPDEDFAETFAVWMTPGGHWKRRYPQGKAREKLEWMETFFQSQKNRSRCLSHIESPQAAGKQTLLAHYQRKRRRWGIGQQDYYLRKLKQCAFVPRSGSPSAASGYLKAHAPLILGHWEKRVSGSSYDHHNYFKKLVWKAQVEHLGIPRDLPDPALLARTLSPPRGFTLPF